MRDLSFYANVAEILGALMSLGGGAIGVFHKLGVVVETGRKEQSHPRFAEWFEWLAIQFTKPDQRHVPAYIAYRDWSPPR